MRLHDTASDTIRAFEPGKVVTMYTCGITPYDSTHLGHAATYLTYDVLQRRLRDLGHETRCVRNVTDVDDSILAKASELGVHYLDLAAAEMARFDADMVTLGMLPSWVRAACHQCHSRHPRGSIGMVLDEGYAYESGGSVYFEVAKFPKFGQVSHYSRDQMPGVRRRTGRQRGRRGQARPAGLRLVAEVAGGRTGVGNRCGGPVARAGTSNARRCVSGSWTPPSTSTAAAPI